MKGDQALYGGVYQSLAGKIQMGFYQQENQFPTQKELCKQYHVGITTIRRVIRMLEKDGFIEATQGKRPVVINWEGEAGIQLLLRRQDSIADILDGMQIIMPGIFLEGAKRCKKEDLEALAALSKKISTHCRQEEYYQWNAAFFDILLQPLQNTLISELITDTSHFLQIPMLPAKTKSATLFKRLSKRFPEYVRFIEEENWQRLYSKFQAMFPNVKLTLLKYLDSLNGSGTVGDPLFYYWHVKRNERHLYNQVALDILKQIDSGLYKDGDTLPSINSLLDRYPISRITASAVFSLLSETGIIQIRQRKRSVVTLPPKQPPVLSSFAMYTHMVQFVRASQLLVLMGKSVASVSFPMLDTETIQRMQTEVRKPFYRQYPSNSCRILLNCLMETVPNGYLKNILEQLSQLFLWGYPLQFSEQKTAIAEEILVYTREAITFAANKNANGFAENTERVFRLVHEKVSGRLLNAGIEAAYIPFL